MRWLGNELNEIMSRPSLHMSEALSAAVFEDRFLELPTPNKEDVDKVSECVCVLLRSRCVEDSVSCRHGSWVGACCLLSHIIPGLSKSTLAGDDTDQG